MTKPCCLVCTNGNVAPVLDLGHTVPANHFVPAEAASQQREDWYPLRVGLCLECGHVQLIEHVPPRRLFDHYTYMSSASRTLTQHLHSLASRLTGEFLIDPHDLVLDVGCNDGTLLTGFGEAGVRRRVGVDPAENLAAASRRSGAEIIVGFFNEALAERIAMAHGYASVITMTNTFPHVPDLNGLLRAIDRVLAPNGVLVLEAHYLGDLIDLCAFDTIYHEHVSYWSLTPMQRLFEAHGFSVFDVERLPIHHGQLRAFVARTGVHTVRDSVAALAREERQHGIADLTTYQKLAPRIERIRGDLLERIASVRASGGRVVGYGAPAKGSTLLSYFGLGPEQLDYIADRNALKQGCVTPGSHIPIVAPERIFEDQPELVVLFAWNFEDEIAAQLAPYLERGGRLVSPIPELREVGGAR